MDEDGLTPPQRRAYQERSLGKTWKDVGLALGVSYQVAREHALKAQAKIEAGKAVAPPPPPAPAATQEIWDVLESGVPRELTRALEDANAGRPISDATKLRLMESAQIRAIALFHDPDKMRKANYSQVAMAFGLVFDKIQLMANRPTEIVRVEDVRKLDEIAEMLEAEMKRRAGQKLTTVEISDTSVVEVDVDC